MSPSSEAAQPSAVIALDLGGTKLAAALCGGDGRLQLRRTVKLAGRQGAAVGEVVQAQVRRLQNEADRQRIKLRGVGVSVPGIAHSRRGSVWAPNIPGWDDFPLLATMKESLHDAAVPVAIDSDRSASILGEAWLGAARGCRDAIFLAVGTGIGAGILSEGRVVRGAHGVAGAIGWLALDRPFRSEYTTYGCFESHASGEGLARRYNELRSNRDSRHHKSPPQASTRDLFAAYEAGDPLARKVLSQAVEFWGMASANLVSLFNPTVIVFGGGVFGPAAGFLEAIAKEAARWAQPVSIRQVRFAASELGPLAALHGAGYLAWRRAGVSRAKLARQAQ